jgi:hypothetical protein
VEKTIQRDIAETREHFRQEAMRFMRFRDPQAATELEMEKATDEALADSFRKGASAAISRYEKFVVAINEALEAGRSGEAWDTVAHHAGEIVESHSALLQWRTRVGV